MNDIRHYLKMKYRALLVWAGVPRLYVRAALWWETKASAREYLKAARMFVQGRRIALRDAVFGATMIVVTKQIQSRAEMRNMSYKQIMRAYRSGRLDYLIKTGDHQAHIGRYGDMAFQNWVNNGGQVHK